MTSDKFLPLDMSWDMLSFGRNDQAILDKLVIERIVSSFQVDAVWIWDGTGRMWLGSRRSRNG